MSRRSLLPFGLVLAFPPQKSDDFPAAERLRSKAMDLAVHPVFKSFLAGSLSGTCSTILFQPLDLVKTRIQNLPPPTAASAIPSASGGVAAIRSVTMFGVVRHVLQTENVFGLWRGITPSITRTVPGVGLYFGSLHWLKTHIGNEHPTPIQAVCLGMAARSVAGVAMIPITVIKTRFESGTYDYPRMSTALVQIYNREGVRGLCCGLVPTLFRDAPYSGIYLMFYTQLKQKFMPVLVPDKLRNGDCSLQAFGHFSCGLLAGVLASLVTHPADVVKTKMQLQPAAYRSVHQAASALYANGGLRAFTTGIAPRMLRRTLMSAMAWTVYEQIMKEFGLK